MIRSTSKSAHLRSASGCFLDSLSCGSSDGAESVACSDDLEQAEANLKGQEAIQREREAAFELANARLTEAFADISNRSLRANSDTFLKLAEQNLGTHQEKAKRELSEREKAVEELVKPIRSALDASHKQISGARKVAKRGLRQHQEPARGHATQPEISDTGNAKSRQGTATSGSPRAMG